MKRYHHIAFSFLLTIFLSSCKFSCSVGESHKDPSGKSVEDEGARVYNNIKVNVFKANLKRAYLVFEDGTRVPDDNFIDFTQPVKLMLETDGGWQEEGGKVFLGASEKVIDENGQVLLDAEDLFSEYPGGIAASDARLLHIKASIRLREGVPPTSFSVQFKVWDKKADGFIEGSYMLFSK